MPLNSTDRDDVSSRITPHIGLLPGAPRGDYQASLRLLARYDPSRSSGAPVRVRRSRHPHRDAAVASQDQAGEDRACRGVQTRLVDLGRMARGLRRPPDHDQHGWGELPAGRLVPAGSARRARSTKDLELLLAGRDAAGGRPGSGGCARSVPGRVTAMTATAREFCENARSEPYDASIITRD